MFLNSLVKKFKAFLKAESTFFKDVSFVFSGKLFVAGLSLFLTPIIARLYLPKDYGDFALYSTVIQNLMVIAGLTLPIAVSTVKKKELVNALNLTITTIISTSILISILLFAFKSVLDVYFSTTLFSKYWMLIALGVFISSLIKTFASLNVRLKKFSLNTKVNTTEATSAKAFNLLGGWLSIGSLGLILSDFIGKLINLTILLINVTKEFKIKLLNSRDAWDTLKKHKLFPLYVMPSSWLGIISNQFIIFLIAYLYDKHILGQFSMAVGLLTIPLNVLSNSFQPVITERLVSIRDGDRSHRFFEKMFLVIFSISALCFITIFILPSSFFTLFLGSKWDKIGPIINVYCWYYLFLFIDQAFQNGFVVLGKQKTKLVFNLIDIALQSIIILLSVTYRYDFIYLLILYTITKSMVSISRVSYLYKLYK